MRLSLTSLPGIAIQEARRSGVGWERFLAPGRSATGHAWGGDGFYAEARRGRGIRRSGRVRERRHGTHLQLQHRILLETVLAGPGHAVVPGGTGLPVIGSTAVASSAAHGPGPDLL